MKNILLITTLWSCVWMSCQQMKEPATATTSANEARERDSSSALNGEPGAASERVQYTGNTASSNNIRFHAKSNAYISRILADLHIKENNPEENLLVFVCTELDCSTCVNEQLTFLTRVLKKEMLNKQVILVTTTQQLGILKTTWEKVLQQLTVEVRSIDQIRSIYQYHHQPIYYLVSAKKQVCLHAFQVDPGATALAGEMVQLYHTLYLQ